MKKKVLSVLLCAAMVGTMLLGCSNGEPAEDNTADTNAEHGW